MECIRILSLDGPIERVGEYKIPIFQTATFGEIEVRGTRVFGIQPKVFIVGRIGVRQIETLDLGDGERMAKVPLGTTHASRVRTTLRRARNTAHLVDAAIPAWDAHVAKLARETEEQRLGEQRALWEAEEGPERRP